MMAHHMVEKQDYHYQQQSFQQASLFGAQYLPPFSLFFIKFVPNYGLRWQSAWQFLLEYFCCSRLYYFSCLGIFKVFSEKLVLRDGSSFLSMNFYTIFYLKTTVGLSTYTIFSIIFSTGFSTIFSMVMGTLIYLTLSMKMGSFFLLRASFIYFMVAIIVVQSILFTSESSSASASIFIKDQYCLLFMF